MRLVFYVLCILLLSGCDYLLPKKKFILAIPKDDFSYNYAADHLKRFLENGGYKLEIKYVKTAIEANDQVAQGQADLSFILNHSTFIPQKLKDHSSKLRTVLPLYTRLMFFFSKEGFGEGHIAETLKNKTVHIEVLNGETHLNLINMFEQCEIDSVYFTDQQPADFYHFWGTFYGERAKRLLSEGWESADLPMVWENFLILNNPALRTFELPGIPGLDDGHVLHTLATETLLVCSSRLGENAIHELSQYIFQHRLKLMGYDRMYGTINEHFDQRQLLYPLHSGTSAFLRRDDPSFLERYADALAFFVSLFAIIYGALQTFRAKRKVRRKERIDTYFLEFLEIKEDLKLSRKEMEDRYDKLLHKVLILLTNEQLNKSDFHILSRLIQQELANLRLAGNDP